MEDVFFEPLSHGPLGHPETMKRRDIPVGAGHARDKLFKAVSHGPPGTPGNREKAFFFAPSRLRVKSFQTGLEAKTRPGSAGLQ
jgi:hypothetical protein